MDPEKLDDAPHSGGLQPERSEQRQITMDPPERDLHWILFGEDGLRVGWSVLLFLVIVRFLTNVLGSVAAYIIANGLHQKLDEPSASSNIVLEALVLLALLIAAGVMALIEHRRITDYNLNGPHRARNFATGLSTGFCALSVLVGGLAAGGWLHFSGLMLAGGTLAGYAALWGVGFLLVGFMEEGTFRCYLQFTLARGLNFWWALAVNAGICAYLLMTQSGNGVWGVYAMALLGLLPCLWLEMRKAPGSGFWQAAWVTSTMFGFVHTGNNGENWIGIFAAGAIGFVFCVSVWKTGSAWWAIGCHTAWDWAETYFYGTPDSGMVAKGHLLAATPAGSALWSGGTDGPEGSLLVLPVIVLLLMVLVLLYRRPQQAMA